MSLLDGMSALPGGLNGSLGDLASSFSSLLPSFASAFGQATRLLKVSFAEESGIPENLLLPFRLTGSEEINGELAYSLEAVSSDVHIEAKRLLGVPIEITILTDSGAEREICGLVMESDQEGSDGGFATYRLVVKSGFSALRQRTTARVFIEADVREVSRRILGKHLEKNEVLKAAFSVDDRCKGTYPVRPFWMQYSESDFDYLRRIWAREGISYVIEPSAKSSSSHPQHTLVLFDDVYDLDANESSSVRFQRADGTEQRDAITQWNGHRTLQAGSVARMSWDHAAASINHAKETSQADQGASGNALASTLERYHHHVPVEGEDPEQLQSLATRRMKALEGQAKRFEGIGTVRTFRAGSWFTLTQHPIHDQDAPQDREFMITRLDVEAKNNLPKDLETGLGGLLKMVPESAKPGIPYANRFTCVRRGIPILADEIAPPDPGLITAQVVGPPGEVVHTDELGRIKVRFLFAREQEHLDAGASGTDADSAWIRQMETWGSQGFGGTFLPRVGDEVCIQFLGGDPDKPIITGSSHNRTKTPTSFSEASVLPNEKALSGIRSQMHKGSGGNELLLDDTTNQLRTRLASDHAASHLNLGYLTHPRSGGVGTPRGEGFELRTDGWGAVRANCGLLLSTYRTTGPHLEADPFTSQMESSLELANALSGVSEQIGGDKLEANESVKKIKEAAQARKVQGQSGKAVPAFNAPVLGLASPDGILSATPASHVMSAGENLHITSGEDTNIGVGRKMAIAVKESFCAFVSKCGIKMFAGKENFDIQAHQGNIQILADKDVQVTSANGELKVFAKTYIRVSAGGCQIELTEKDVNLYMSGALNVHSNLSFGGEPTGMIELPRLPKAALLEKKRCSMLIDWSDLIGKISEEDGSIPYAIYDKQGKTMLLGDLDSSGKTRRVYTDNEEEIVATLLDGRWSVFVEKKIEDENSDGNKSDTKTKNKKKAIDLDFVIVDKFGQPVKNVLITVQTEKSKTEMTSDSNGKGCAKGIEGKDISLWVTRPDGSAKTIASIPSPGSDAVVHLVCPKLSIKTKTVPYES